MNGFVDPLGVILRGTKRDRLVKDCRPRRLIVVSEAGSSPEGGGGNPLSSLLRTAGDVFKKLGAQDDDSKSSVVRMAAAISTDTVSAASAFAAASTIASHTRSFTKSASLTDEEEAQLLEELLLAKDVRTPEALESFFPKHDLARIVKAARVLDGRGRASALTTLANFAVLKPDYRRNILLADHGSITESISRMLVGIEAAWSGGAYLPACEIEGIVSGTHLLGSLAITRGEVGTEWRRRIAQNKEVRRVIRKFAYGQNESAARAARRALATLGVNEWKPKVAGQTGLRILSIDGGGTRALLTFEMLKHIKKLMGKDIHEMFDVICGTSTGAIIAASIGIRRKSVEECEKLYRELIGKVFCKGPMATPKMVLTRAYYDSKILESVLQRECGKGVFIDSTAEEGMPKVCVVSSKLGTSDVTCHTFRNYTYPVGSESRFAGTPDAQLWEALRASSAAPTFFTEKLLNGTLHADGAIVANNPTAVAIHEAQSIFPGIPIELVVSMGNGLAEPKFVDLWKEGSKDKQLGWYDILDSYIYAAVQTEDVHHMLVELLPPEKYFRFNPKTRCAGIDEVRPEKLVEMVDDANRYIEASGERFRRLSEILKPRGMRHFWNQISYAIGMEVRYVQNLFDPVFREEEVATES